MAPGRQSRRAARLEKSGGPRRRRRLGLAFLAVFVLSAVLALGLGTVASAAEVFQTTQISNPDYFDRNPQLSGDRVVWQGTDVDGYAYIFTWAVGDAAPTRLSDNAYYCSNPQVSGDRVVWQGEDADGYCYIFTWAVGDAGPTRLSDASHYCTNAQVSGDRVVWQGDDGSGAHIYVWAAGDDEPTQLASWGDLYYNHDPQIDGDRLAWLASDGYIDDICTWAVGDAAPMRLTDNAYPSDSIRISGDRLVWRYLNRIYTWAVGDAAPMYIMNGAISSGDRLPDISGDRAVWEGNYIGKGWRIFTWVVGGTHGDPLLDTSYATLGPRISGDRLVWYGTGGTDGGTDYEIYTWVLGEATPTQLTLNGIHDWNPRISGDRVVWWTDYRTECEIYTWGPVAPADVTGVAPGQGPLGGGNTVTITGSGFTGATAVTFDGIDATSFNVVSYWSIEAVAPAHAAGTVTVHVTAPGGDSTQTDNYAYVDAPTVTAVNAIHGPTAGGQTVTITGTDFVGLSGTSAVTFGGTDAASYTAVSDTEITAVTPAHSWGLVTVQVTAAGGASAEVGNFTFIAPAPVITSITPNSGPDTGGGLTDIHGTGFTGLQSVTFGGVAATLYEPALDTYMLVYAPAHAAGLVTVQVAAEGGTSAETNNYTYIETKPTRFEQSDGRFYFSPAWPTSSYWRYSGGGEKYSTVLGASVYVPFRGTRLDWITKTNSALGIASVSVDGGAPVSVDLYSASTVYQKKVWSTGNLPNGLHWVKIVHSGLRNPRSSGVSITIDAVDVVGTLVWPTRYQENDPAVGTAGNWSPSWSWNYSGGRMVSTSVRGSSLTVHFNGAKLNLLAAKGRYSGKAWVSLDGGPRTLVDLYSYASAYKQVVYSTGFLAPGPHTVTISYSGYKNAASRGYGINVDAFDITGEVRGDT
jgi:hypothetical protein